MKILLCYGTRPEWLKIKPLWSLSEEFKLLRIGQHTDLIKGLPHDYEIEYDEIGNGRLNDIVVNNLKNLPDITNFDAILVQGDTTSAFSIALSAYHLGIPIIHLEAGLRTYVRNPYPEEFNRRAISLMADIHLCPTQGNIQHLYDEKVGGEKFIVGNTVLDNLVGITTQKQNKVLITLHRRENLDNIEEWFEALNNVANQYNHLEFYYPMHPNPQIQQHKNKLTNVNIIEPLNHDDLINLMKTCNFIITDSGGIQEEASFLKIPTLVCRDSTERTEIINLTSWLVAPDNLVSFVEMIDKNLLKIPKNYICPYGKGDSSRLILEILRRYYNG
jgi:UDP-N-acetylglucosamine 2-epimerase (non-hydrolysing)